MGYPNLKAELARKDITFETISKLLNIHRNSVANKVKGKSSFSIEESIEIQKELFPEMSIDYLFAQD